MIASPASMASPSDLSQETTRPSFIVEERAGMVILMASALSAVVERALVMALLDGRMAEYVDGVWVTKAETDTGP